MGKILVIKKRISDVVDKTKIQKLLPLDYPVECSEYETIEEAIQDGGTAENTFTVEVYKEMQKQFAATYEAAEAEADKPPFWAFWRKI